MKKSKFLIPLACFGLLLTALAGCGKEPAESPSSSKAPTSASASASSADKSSSSAAASTEDPLADKYYSLPFGYDEPTKWEKGHEYKWTFDVKENHAKMEFAFGAEMSNDSHSTRSLYTNHEGASSSDPFESNAANDGTPRITVKVNGVEQTIYDTTYGDAGLTTTELNYFRVAQFAVKKGNVEVSMTTHASVGYRLLLGGEARLYYPAQEQPLNLVKVTFMNGTEKVHEDEYFPGEVPALPANAALPAKAADANGAYIFRGWDKEIVAVAATDTAVTYNAVFDAVPFVVRNAKLEAKDNKLLFNLSGDMKVQDTAGLVGKIEFKHNGNADGHGWEWENNAYEAEAVFGQGTFSLTVDVLAINKLIEFRNSTLIIKAHVGENSYELKNEYNYYANAVHTGADGAEVKGTWSNMPNVAFEEAVVAAGDIKANIVVGEWTCVNLVILNESIKAATPTAATLKLVDGVVYYVVTGENIGYTLTDLQEASIDYQHNQNIDGKGWYFYPKTELSEADSKTNLAGHKASYAKLNEAGDAFEIGFAVSANAADMMKDADGNESVAKSVFSIHFSPIALADGVARSDLKVPVAEDAVGISLNGFRFSILRSADTWWMADLVVSKDTDFAYEGAKIESDASGVYYVAFGMAGDYTKAQLETGFMTLQTNENSTGSESDGWAVVTSDLAAAKVELNETTKEFKQYFRVDDLAAAKPLADGAFKVFTTKINPTADAGVIEMKVANFGGNASVGGYEYSITQNDNTWGISSLTIKKLAA